MEEQYTTSIEDDFLEAFGKEEDSASQNFINEFNELSSLNSEPEPAPEPEPEPEPEPQEPAGDTTDWRKLYEENNARVADLEEKIQILASQRYQQPSQPHPPAQQLQSEDDPNYIVTAGELRDRLTPYEQRIAEISNFMAYQAYTNEQTRARAAIEQLSSKYANDDVKFEDALDPRQLSSAIEEQIRKGVRNVDWAKYLDTAYNAKAAHAYKEKYFSVMQKQQQQKQAVTKKAAKVPPSTGAQITEAPVNVNPHERGYKSTKKAFMNDLAQLY